MNVPDFCLSQLVFWFLFIFVLSLFAFSVIFLAFQHFTREHCLQLLGLRMRSVAWDRFPIKNCLWIALLVTCVENNYLNNDTCKSESWAEEEITAQSAVPWKLAANSEFLIFVACSNKIYIEANFANVGTDERKWVHERIFSEESDACIVDSRVFSAQKLKRSQNWWNKYSLICNLFDL